MNQLKAAGRWAVSERGRSTIRKWSFRSALIFSAVTVLCWVDFLALSYLEQSSFRPEDEFEYFIYECPSFPFLIAGFYAAFGAIILLVAGGLLMLCEFALSQAAHNGNGPPAAPVTR
ncbi:hypothetical protein WJU23_07180 [Prosthecobacter sp. SYSU 5D2]|uniref:hypothetical protein n=1 Tax=Prosthecobacter sp. SYSU 5D2 TaxID=3134134 RepID=UPI0031FEEC73